MSDIIERLTRHAEVSDKALGVETALGRLPREAADVIKRLRAEINAAWGIVGVDDAGSDDVT